MSGERLCSFIVPPFTTLLGCSSSQFQHSVCKLSQLTASSVTPIATLHYVHQLQFPCIVVTLFREKRKLQPCRAQADACNLWEEPRSTLSGVLPYGKGCVTHPLSIKSVCSHRYGWLVLVVEIMGSTTTILYGLNILFDPVHEDLPLDPDNKGVTTVSFSSSTKL